MSTLSIEKVQHSELPILQHIAITTFSEAFGPPHNSQRNMDIYLAENLNKEKILSEWEHPESVFYFAKKAEKIVGYLKLNTGAAQTESMEESYLEVERIYVITNYKNQGIGQALMNFAIQSAILTQKAFIWLGVWEKNPKAIRFYERNGFSIFSEHIFLMVDDPQRDVLMRRTIDLPKE